MKNKQSGLKEIARIANVDVSTVSRALSGSLRVHPKTKQQIFEIAERINYQPNELARGLVKGVTKSIGVIVPEISNSFYAGVISSIEEIVVSEGYSILLGLSHYESKLECKYVELFRSRVVDGLIIFCGNCNESSRGERIRNAKIPIVLLDYGTEIDNADIVATNHIYGIKLGVEHLVGLGHSRIAYITDEVTTKSRLEAFKIYAGESGLDCSSYIICAPDKYEYGGYSATRTLFDAPTKPTAIICANDYMAIGAMKALSDLDIKVPEEVSVLGFDDSTLLNYLVKSLTTIKQHKHRLGEEAGRLLLQRMHEHTLSDLQSPLVNIVIKPELIVRDSTGPCCEARRNIQMLS